MKNIWEEAQIAVAENGAKFEIDFVKRNLKINKKYIIKNGEYEGKLGYEDDSLEDVLEMIESLYELYKYSVPSEREDNARHHYFKALKADELTDDDMCLGQPRNVARLQLELYILVQIINGNLKWTDDMGKWFWQSKNDKDLIILKQWVCGKA